LHLSLQLCSQKYGLCDLLIVLCIHERVEMDGDVLAPMVGSWVSHYALWCYLRLSIFVFGSILGLAMLLYLPETLSWGNRAGEDR
jgi:hypothetical protein